MVKFFCLFSLFLFSCSFGPNGVKPKKTIHKISVSSVNGNTLTRDNTCLKDRPKPPIFKINDYPEGAEAVIIIMEAVNEEYIKELTGGLRAGCYIGNLRASCTTLAFGIDVNKIPADRIIDVSDNSENIFALYPSYANFLPESGSDDKQKIVGEEKTDIYGSNPKYAAPCPYDSNGNILAKDQANRYVSQLQNKVEYKTGDVINYVVEAFAIGDTSGSFESYYQQGDNTIALPRAWTRETFKTENLELILESIELRLTYKIE